MPEQDLARIAFVTRRFEELQGLRSASLGAGLILSVVAWSLLPGEQRMQPYPHLPLAAQMTLLGLTRGLDGFYARSFGRVPRTPRFDRAYTPSIWLQPGVRVPMLIVMAMLVDVLKDPYLPRLSFAGAILAGYSLWVVVRDWPHRIHHVLGTVAGLTTMIIFASLPVTERPTYRLDPETAAGLALSYSMIGVALLAVGLLDHRLLVTELRGSESDRQQVSCAPDRSASVARMVSAAAWLVTTALYVAFAGWPTHSVGLLYLALCCYVPATMLLVSVASGTGYDTGRYRRAYSELTRAREERLLAHVRGIRENATSETLAADVAVPVPLFDSLGHLALPLAIGCGALVDIGIRGAGLPSFLALALAASHLRIALRDWPSRRYYLLGTVTASMSAIHFMFVPQQQALDWMIWFLIAVCTAMLVEGLLDYRLASKLGDRFARDTHAAA